MDGDKASLGLGFSRRYVSFPMIAVVVGFLVLGYLSTSTIRAALLTEKKNQTQHLVQTAVALVDQQIDRQHRGELSLEQAQAEALNQIKAMRYGDGNYFWVNDRQPRMVMHPIAPELDGRDLSGIEDPNGKLLFQEFVTLANEQGRGFVDYLWPKPGSAVPEPKLSYIILVEEWDWIVGSGIYIDDIERLFWNSIIKYGALTLAMFLLTSLLTVMVFLEFNRSRRRAWTIDAENKGLDRKLKARQIDLEERNQQLAETCQQLEEVTADLEQSERRFRGIADASDDAFVVFEAGRSLYANQAAARLFGREDFTNCTLEELVTISRQPGKKHVARQLLSQEHYPIEIMVVVGDGSERCLEVSVVYFDLKFHDRFAIVARDITSRKAFEEQIVATNKQLEQSIKQKEEMQEQLLQSEKLAAIGELAAGVAHEINNPVGYVGSNVGALKNYVDNLMGYGEALSAYICESGLEFDQNKLNALREQYDIDYIRSDIDETMNETSDGVRRIKNIVQDLKNFARSSSGEWEPVELNREIDSTLNVVWNELKYKCEVVKDYGELPAVDCIRSEINQVVMNLCVNASHAISERGTITLRTAVEGERALITVSDTGKGIKPEHLDKIFNPFFTTKPVGKGTGLGLAVSHGIVEKHGGTIEVESEPGKGTTFRVWLPLKKPELAAETCEQEVEAEIPQPS